MILQVNLTAKQVKGLRDFAEDWAHYHLEGRAMSAGEALLVCVFYTAVGPLYPNQVGASGADPAEIDMPDLVAAVKKAMGPDPRAGKKGKQK